MTILDYLEFYAANTPKTIALKDCNGEISYKQLLNGVNSCHWYLKEYPCRVGSKVILKLRAKQEWIITFLSLLTLECYVIPVPDDITDYEAEQIKKATGADLIIDFFNIPYLDGGNSGLSRSNGRGGGLLHMTSGSTGEPKFCIRTVNDLTREGESYKTAFQLKSHDLILALCPIYHSFALGAGLMAALTAGAGLFTADTFVPRKALKLLKEEAITMVCLVPAMADLLCKVSIPDKMDLSKIRILVGAGKITEELYQSFLDRFHVPLLSNYGSTETGGVITRTQPGLWQSIGKPMPGVSIKVLMDNNETAGAEQEGQLWVKNSGMFQGYYKKETAGFDADGYYPMGDIVYYDEEGNLYLVGRRKFMINIGGRKIYPGEIEKVLLELAGIKDCAVTGILEEDGRERIMAYIVGDKTGKEIRQYCEQKLSPNKIPAIIERVEKIPRNEMGKILYSKLGEGNSHGTKAV